MNGKFALRITVVLALAGWAGRAQTPTGTISGQVLDPTGAAVSGASVRIVDAATNETRTLQSDSSGRDVQPFLRPGKYSIQVSAATGIGNLLISGWSVNGIVTWTSGTPLVLSGAFNDTGLKSVYSEPVLTTGQSAAVNNASNAHWFNPAAFAEPGQFQLGDVSRTLPNLRTPGFADVDFSLFKNNYFGHDGKYNVQFRFETFNAFNHPNFGSPDTNINDSTAGQITSTNANYNPREIQLAMKFYF